ncbi:MAG: hypothetical protein ABFD49_08210 [Armatimonadota bacterium]|nr:hypothetical protein [bacterium]
MNHRKIVIAAIILLFGVLLGHNAFATLGPSVDYEDLSLSNEYIRFTLGVKGTYTEYDADGNEVAREVPGRYAVMTKTGDPTTDEDNNCAMTYGAPYPRYYYAYWKVKVGDDTPVLIGSGSDGSGAWSDTNPPTLYSTPTAGNTLGVGGPYLEGTWVTADDPAVSVTIHASLVRDLIRYELTVTNKSKTTQSIGLAMLGDVQVTSSDSGEYPFVSGIGLSRTSESEDAFPGTIWSGTHVPDLFDIYDTVDDQVRVARCILDQQDCTAPNYIAVGNFKDLAGVSVWLPDGYAPNELVPITDAAYLLQWKQASLGAGKSRTYVTYYGLGVASSVWTGSDNEQDSAVAAVQGPGSVRFDSSTNDTGDPEDDLTPSPFTISAYVYNTCVDPGNYELQDVSAYLYLPDGLDLASTSSAAQEIGNVPIGTESTAVSWSVVPNGKYCGELEYYVVFTSSNGWQQTVSRTIMVPAAKRKVLNYGYQMVSVPFGFNNPSIEHVFGMTAGLFSALYYDAVDTKDYISLDNVESGQGFWMKVHAIKSGKTVAYDIADDASILGESYGKQSKEQYVELSKGWNMVGNPFVYPIYVGQLMVYNESTNTTCSFADAVQKSWISRTIYGWNQETSAYDRIKTDDCLIEPWKGYWVRAKKTVTLVFRPSIWPDSSVSSLSGGY